MFLDKLMGAVVAFVVIVGGSVFFTALGLLIVSFVAWDLNALDQNQWFMLLRIGTVPGFILWSAFLLDRKKGLFSHD